MIFEFQSECYDQLKLLADHKHRSILIEGLEGSGKTYMAKQYSDMVHSDQFVTVNSSVQDIRDAIQSCYEVDGQVSICIENLDSGVVAASYALLKFLEEPVDGVYVIVTCRNMYDIPDTIVSRSSVVSLNTPTRSDIFKYISHKYKNKHNGGSINIQDTQLFSCISSFKDVDTVFNMSESDIEYFESSLTDLDFSASTNTMIYKLSKYPDGRDCPVDLVIRFIMSSTKSLVVHRIGLDCLNELSKKRLGKYAILGKFCMDLKYLV